MSAFCGSCGAPLGEQSGFCGSCGARAGQAPAAPVAPVAAKAAGGGSALKIVAIIVGVLFVLGAVSLGGMYYAARRYVKIAEDVTGIKAGDVARSIREAGERKGQEARAEKRDGCLLLSKDEASAILGIEVERVDGKPNEHESGEHCDFFVKAGSIAENAERLKQSADAIRSEPGADPNKLPPGAADMLKNLARGTVEAARNGEAPYFGYTVERENGKLTFSAFGIADRLGGGDLSTASEPLSVGDKAAMGLGESRLCVVKGNSAVTLDLTQITGARAKGIALAKTIISRL